MRHSALTLDHSVIEEVRSRFSYPAYEKLPHMPDELKQAAHDPLFERWRKELGVPHKVQGYSIVTLSLKPVGGPPGDATADQMDAVADLADKYSFGEIRVGHEQNLVLPHVAKRDLPRCGRRSTRSASPRRTSIWSPTSSPARGWTIARWPMHARSDRAGIDPPLPTTTPPK